MEVVLLERVEKLGQMGDVVSVKDGFARNFLLPQNKALRATKNNLARFEQDRAQLEARNLERRGEAEKVGEKLDNEQFVILRQAGESGQLYGSVSSRDIAVIVSENGFSVEKGQVTLDRPIKTLGLFPVRVSLHPEVTVSVTVNVARSEEEAERQARGEDVTASIADDDEVDAEALFETEELAQEALGTAQDEETSADANETGDETKPLE